MRVVLASVAGDALMATLARGVRSGGVEVELVGLDPSRDDSVHVDTLRCAMAGAAILGGFSLGARIAAGLCSELAPRGLLCFGYPFHAVGQPSQRDGLAVLSRVGVLTRIIQGARDNHGTQGEVRSYTLPSSTSVVWIEDGNHRFAPRKGSLRTAEQNVETAVNSALAFIAASLR